MSSKKTKSTKESKVNKKSPRKTSYRHELVAPDCWVNELADIEINDGSWKCSATIIEEESTESSVYMEHFNESTISGNRLSVKKISILEVIHYVVKNRSENHPEKSITPLQFLCSEVFKLVGPEFKNKIPTPLLASLIKYLILEYKNVNKKIREGIEKRKKELEDYQQSLWQTPVKHISSKETKSSKLENKNNKLDKVSKTSEKPFTKLRKRGEEWKDKTWIDDSPNDGPQLYIAISTFYDPDLPLELLHLNIPLHAIARLTLWETSSASRCKLASVPIELRDIFRSLQDFRHKSTPNLSSTIRKRLGNQSDKAENSEGKISSFWKTIHKLKTELPTALMLKNVMFLCFTPEHFSFQYHIKPFQEEIYKQISYFLYDVHEIMKQHIQYLSEINQTGVYATETIRLSNMTVYQSLLDSIPHETLNIPFLLDAIIIQACSLENEAGQKETLSELSELENTKEKSVPVASNYLKKLLRQLNLKYDLFSDQFNYNDFNEGKYKNNDDSCNIKHILKHFDDTNITTFHVQEDISEFVRKRTTHILQVAWNDILLGFFSTSHNDANVYKLCVEIIQTAKESDDRLLYYYIYILVVNSIRNSLLINDFSYSYLKTDTLKGSIHYDKDNLCEDCVFEVHNEEFSIVSILRNKLSNLSSMSSKVSTYKLSDDIVDSDLLYIENMSTDVMLQWIQTSRYSFSKFETRYCPFTNKVVLVFHNLPNPRSGLFEENWIGKLTTYVPIRDFVEYILEEEKDWLAQFQSQLTVESTKLDKAVTFDIDKPFPDELPSLFPEHQFISHRSLKYEILMKHQKNENPFQVPSEKSKSPKAKTVSKQSDSSKKSKGNSKQKEKQMSETKLELKENFQTETLQKKYTFTGYDLGDPMRFQFSGLKKEKILDGCCRITLQTMTKLYGEKTQTLTVTISGHSLYYMYKPYCENTLVNPFHLILSSGIVLYFGLLNKETKEPGSCEQIQKTFKRTSTKQASLLINSRALETEFITHPTVIPRVEKRSEFVGSDDFTPNEWNNSCYLPHILNGVPYFEIPLTYELSMSLPNGLHIELEKDCSLFYVRQTIYSRSQLANGVKNEKLRCYLSNGCIIKFFSNDTVQILSPNGLVYTVFETKKRSHKPNKAEFTEPSEGTPIKPTLSDISVKKIRRVSLKTEESSKSSKAKTVQKNDKNYTPNVVNTEETRSQEMEKITNLTNTFDFECTTSDGKRFAVQNKKVTKVLKDLFTTHTTNVAENCIDSKRTDGVATKHLSDGSVLVQFTDGSRITSTPFEAGEVFCEWSPEELKQWFFDSSVPMFVDTELKIEQSLSNPSKKSYMEKKQTLKQTDKPLAAMDSFANERTSIQSEQLPNDYEKELKMSVLDERKINSEFETIISKTTTRTLLTSSTDQYAMTKPFYHEDGFLVYHISYLMEHPNYISVYYNAINCEVELKLPLNTSITLKNDGCYEALFDQASLSVDNDEIFFCKLSGSGDFERTTIINNSATNNKTPVDCSNYFNRMTSLPLSVDEFCQSTGMKSLLRDMVRKTETKSGLLLYCVDSKINEIIVDYDFNIYEARATEDKYLPSVNSFTPLVINENLSGFRLVSYEEVNSHIKHVTEKGGLIRKIDNAWKSLLTTIPVVTNESERWLMNYQKNMAEMKNVFIKTSTYGKRESWMQPFLEKEEKGQDLVDYKATIVRLLHRIPAEENTLDKLNVAITNYSRKTRKKKLLYEIKLLLEEAEVEFSLDKLIRNPKLLCKIITDENAKRNKEKDQFRKAMKHDFLRSLITKAIIKARKIRKDNKKIELKSALRRKEIPPYHHSGFGYAHNILFEVFQNATNVSKKSSFNNNCEKVNYIIDELLSLVCKIKQGTTTEESYSGTNETDSIGVQSLVSSIFRNVCTLTQDRNRKNYINTILEKPLTLVTPEDIELINKTLGSGNCPLFYDEEFILQDILDARLQLSNYFENLRAMLEFYRGIHQPNTKSNYCIDQ